MAKNDTTPANDESDPRVSGVSGYQEGVHHPKQPRTPAEFAELLTDPDTRAEFQSAPSPEKLNPHLFPERL